MTNDIAVPENNSVMAAWSPKEVMVQVQAIQQLMRDGMKDKEHYGVIPGCGDKPALLKPGAEKLGLMFRLGGKYTIEEVNLPNGHLDVKVKCALYHITTGQFWGEGIGSCSTMESKFRYRTGKGANTGIPVPKNYWDLKRTGKYKEAQELLGVGYATEKVDGTWFIVEKIDKAENPDIADTYNTVRKMAKKRAFVDAMLSATAASDIFTQDLEDLAETPKTEVAKETVKPQETVPAATQNDESLISHDMALEIIKQIKAKGIEKEDYLKYLKYEFNIGGTNKIKLKDYDKVMEWLIVNMKETEPS